MLEQVQASVRFGPGILSAQRSVKQRAALVENLLLFTVGVPGDETRQTVPRLQSVFHDGLARWKRRT
jgi:hypothetical protein